MNHVNVEEWQALSFFEVEPQFLDHDPNVPWCYNESTYVVERRGHRLIFTLSPAYRDVQIILWVEDKQVYRYDAKSIEDVRYNDEHSNETLEIVISECERIVLRVKPVIEILRSRA